MTNAKPKNFETSLEELERIVRELEQGELTLEKSLELFEQGVKLSRECQERLTQAERRIEVLMRTRLISKLLVSSLMGVLLVVIPVGAGKRNQQNNAPIELQGVSITLTRSLENPRLYSLVISDDDEHTISGSFSMEQLQILRAIMSEAEKLALSEDASGSKEPVTTRFADKQERAFVVDVEKLGVQSRLFLTLKTEMGQMTMNAGRVIRSTRREEGFYFELLSRLESILPKLPVQVK